MKQKKEQFKVHFDGKDLYLKYGIAEMILFQEVKGYMFADENHTTMMDIFYMLWCSMQVANGSPISFEKINEFVDNNQDVFVSYINWLTEFFSQLSTFKNE